MLITAYAFGKCLNCSNWWLADTKQAQGNKVILLKSNCQRNIMNQQEHKIELSKRKRNETKILIFPLLKNNVCVSVKSKIGFNHLV